MTAATIFGAIATICSIVSFTPQAWKIIKSRRTTDLSAGAYTLTVTGFACWTTYGILLGEWPLIVANSICLCLSAFILLMKLLPKSEKDKIADALDPTKN